MPPKKTAASSTKEKAPAKKGKTLKEKQVSEEDKTEEVPKKRSRAAASKTSESSAAKPTKSRSTKDKKDPPPESENGVEPKPSKATKAKPKKTEKSEDPGTSKAPKATATKSKRGKKEETEKPVGEEEPPSEPASKRAASKRKAKKPESDDASPTEGKKSKPAANPSATDWDSVEFDSAAESASGEPSNFRIASWNVDGMRAWLRKGGLELLHRGRPDILCLQETKCSKEKIPEEMNGIEGYESFWCCSEREGYAGVGTLTRRKPLNVVYGIGSEEHDGEGRCVTLEMEDFYLVNVYVPNAGRKLVTLPKRLDWNTDFKAFIKKLDEKKPVIICGDMNVAHQEIDLANPKTNTKNAGFTVEERDGMTDFLQEGYIDTFRDLYPEKQAYTFWTYMMNSRSKNVGWRLDYFITSERFKQNVCDNVILQNVLGSDHCPIVLYINV